MFTLYVRNCSGNSNMDFHFLTLREAVEAHVAETLLEDYDIVCSFIYWFLFYIYICISFFFFIDNTIAAAGLVTQAHPQSVIDWLGNI